MAEVKWIKLDLSIFKNRKIEQIEVMPEGDGIIVIWFKLMCLAGIINDNGMVYFTREIPYTEEMLATQFHRPLQLIRLALSVFQRFGMIEVVDDIIQLSNWEKYQSVDRLTEIREYNRVAQQKRRLRLKAGSVNDMSMTSQRCQGTEVEVDVDKEGDRDAEKERVGSRSSRVEPRDGGDADLIQRAARDCGLPWNPYHVKLAARLEQTYGRDWLVQAIERVAIRSKQTWGAVEGILSDWQKKGGVDEPYAKRAASDDTGVNWAVGGASGH